MKRALLFAGQGSQYVGMTMDLVQRWPDARALGDQANDLLGYDLVGLMQNGPSEQLTETRYTQPALFVHEAMVLAITQAHDGADMVAGHSLGEFSAYYAAGVLSFADAVRLVALRGRLMFEAGEAVPGTMAAVVGLDDDKVEALCAEHNRDTATATIVPANYNAPGQVVISGSREYVRELLSTFKAAGAKLVKELNVSGAFHSPLLNSASEEFSGALDDVAFADATIPVYTNVDGIATTEAALLRAAAARQLTAPVRWTRSLQAIEADGGSMVVEVGPGSVLQGLAKRTLLSLAPEACLGLDTEAQCQKWIDEH